MSALIIAILRRLVAGKANLFSTHGCGLDAAGAHHE